MELLGKHLFSVEDVDYLGGLDILGCSYWVAWYKVTTLIMWDDMMYLDDLM